MCFISLLKKVIFLSHPCNRKRWARNPQGFTEKTLSSEKRRPFALTLTYSLNRNESFPMFYYYSEKNDIPNTNDIYYIFEYMVFSFHLFPSFQFQRCIISTSFQFVILNRKQKWCADVSWVDGGCYGMYEKPFDVTWFQTHYSCTFVLTYF